MTDWSFASDIYGNAWAPPAMRELFSDVTRTKGWLELLANLAELEGEFGIIPETAAEDVSCTCRSILVDRAFLDEFRQGYEATKHSTAGLIAAVACRCPRESGQWVHYGATVQDIADTWMMLTLQKARRLLLAELEHAIDQCTELSTIYRDTLMMGRTHGQLGVPITFGFKAAGWLAELRRHRQRFHEIATRMDVGQLSGAVGTLSSFGPKGLELQKRFLDRVGLWQPDISWTSSRDLVAEWAHLLVLSTATCERIGHEIYNLQRDEIGEVREGASAQDIGSITMPHKRNPELSEQLGTLARVVRANAGMIDESLIHDHERDGRSWKIEWHAVPELTIAAGQAHTLLVNLLENLEVRPERMLQNVRAAEDAAASDPLMLALARHVGKLTAHDVVHRVAREARSQGKPLAVAALEDPQVSEYVSREQINAIFSTEASAGQSGALVDRLLALEVECWK